MSSISVIPGALALVTLKVTGPAATLGVSMAQVSLPESLAIVTLTVFAPPLAAADVAALLLAESLCAPQPLSASAVAAASTGPVSRQLRRKWWGHTDLVCRFMVIVLPFFTCGRNATGANREDRRGHRGGAEQKG